MRHLITAVLFAAFAIAAPAKAAGNDLVQQYLDKELIKRWDQVNNLAWPILANNAEICPDIKGNLAGYTASTLPDGSGQVVFHVATDSPADQAGLQRGDVIVSLNGKGTSHRKAEKAEEGYKKALGSALSSGSRLDLSILRQGAPQNLSLSTVPGCDIELVYTGTATPTMMNERQIMIGTIMENYVRTAEEAQIYLSREFARVILDQAGSNRRFDKGMGTVMGLASRVTGHNLDNAYANRAIGNMMRGGKQDEAADTLSLYLAARAGVDVSQAPAFWEHVFANRTGNQALGRLLGNSPGSPERLETFRQTAQSISQLQHSGQPILPSGS